MNRVLIIQSDVTSRLQLEAAVRRGDFEPIIVADADGAIAALDGERPPRIVVMGWEIPGSEGLGLLRWLRSDRSREGIWVLMLTGRGTRDEEIEALDAGADDFVVKPVDAVRLRAHLRAGARRIAHLASLECGGDVRKRAA